MAVSTPEQPHSHFQDLRTSRIEEDAEFDTGRPSPDVTPHKSDFPQYIEWMGSHEDEQTAARGQLQAAAFPTPVRSYG